MRKRKFEVEQEFKDYDKLKMKHALMDLGEACLNLGYYSVDHREPITIKVSIEGKVDEG